MIFDIISVTALALIVIYIALVIGNALQTAFTISNGTMDAMATSKMIPLDEVLNLLREYGDCNLKDGMDELPHVRPAHGPCCTCQTCGHCYDECVCTHNEIIRKLKLIMSDAKRTR